MNEHEKKKGLTAIYVEKVGDVGTAGGEVFLMIKELWVKRQGWRRRRFCFFFPWRRDEVFSGLVDKGGIAVELRDLDGWIEKGLVDGGGVGWR